MDTANGKVTFEPGNLAIVQRQLRNSGAWGFRFVGDDDHVLDVTVTTGPDPTIVVTKDRRTLVTVDLSSVEAGS